MAAFHWVRVATKHDPVSRGKYQALRTRGHGHARSSAFGGRPAAERRMCNVA